MISGMPHVAAVRVVAVEHTDDAAYLCAFVVSANTSLSPMEMSARIKHNLRRLGSAVPSVVSFLSSLPLSSSGKVDVVKLKTMARETGSRCVFHRGHMHQ